MPAFRIQPRSYSLCFLPFLLLAFTGRAQRPATHVAPPSSYARQNAFGVFGAYSETSSHILMGIAEDRKLLEIGVVYNRRLLLKRTLHWQYSAEYLPVALESDPVQTLTIHQTAPLKYSYTIPAQTSLPACKSGTASYSNTETINGVTYVTSAGTYDVACSRRWTMGQALSPVGFQVNFRPRHTLQPFLIGHGGYMYSNRPIPTETAGSFNFTFDGGAGLELFRTRSQSVRAEYRYHHISNHDTANMNPGIDNGVFQLTYVFGR